MTRNRAVLLLSLLFAGAALTGYGYVQRSGSAATQLSVTPPATAAERTILYYRDPSGAPNWSAKWCNTKTRIGSPTSAVPRASSSD